MSFSNDDLYNLAVSEEFRAYRRKEFEVAAETIQHLFNQRLEPEAVKGALEAVKRIIRIPSVLAKGEPERVEFFTAMVAEDMKHFEAALVREAIKVRE